MKEFIYDEMMKNIKKIREMEPKEPGSDGVYPVSENDQMLLDTVETVTECTTVARREGLLSLDGYVEDIKDFQGAKYLRSMMMLVVDGVDPEQLTHICLTRYCSSKLSDYGALQYLIMLEGALGIQRGENPRIVEETIRCMLPEELADELVRREELARKMWYESAEQSEKYEPDPSIIDRVCEGDDIALCPGDRYYFIIKMVDHLLLELDDHSIRRLLRDVENMDLAVAMKGISGKARRRILDNLSERLAIMIADDMEFIGPVRLEDLGSASKKLFSMIVRLTAAGEIAYSAKEILEEMATVFLNLEDETAPESSYETRAAESKLYDLWKEYLSHSHKLVDIPHQQ